MKKLFFLLIGISLLAACGDDDSDNTGTGTTPKASKNINANPTLRSEYSRLEMPHIKGGSTNLVIVHSTAKNGVNYIV